MLACYLAAVSRFFAAQAFRIMLPSRAVRGGRRRRAGAALSLQAVLRLQRLEGRLSSAISKVSQTGPARRTAASARDFRGEPCELAACKTLASPPFLDRNVATAAQANRTVGPLAGGFALETWRCGLGMRTALSLRGRIAHKAKLRAPGPARHRAIYACVSSGRLRRRETAPAIITTTAPK